MVCGVASRIAYPSSIVLKVRMSPFLCGIRIHKAHRMDDSWLSIAKRAVPAATLAAVERATGDLFAEAKQLGIATIHLDDIDPRLRDRSLWMPMGLSWFSSAVAIGAMNKWGGLKKRNELITLSFSLRSTKRRKGVHFATCRGLAQRLSDIPPELTICYKGGAKWRSWISRGKAIVLPEITQAKTFYTEWYNREIGEYVRVVWLVG